MPQLENALLAGHDMIFLGERGQAKTRMIRSLTGLLDEWMPIVAGSEINDDPYAPGLHATPATSSPSTATTRRSTGCTATTATARSWPRPDTSIADLIGEVDPIKVAEGRYLSDELTLHYGLVPRTNRGIFAINELPDLAERIQVGLLNVLEERDVQVRGYKIRLPLDVLLVASANPEDYTNRGRIITPLKDRFGSQIRTHYPLDVDDRGGDHAPGGPAARSVGDVPVRDARLHGRGRRHVHPPGPPASHVNQRSASRVRLSVANIEVLAANAAAPGAARRRARRRAPGQRPRGAGRVDVGKIEIESLEEGREGQIVENLLKAAVLTVFKERLPPEQAPRRRSPPSTRASWPTPARTSPRPS